jgi:hypothetical protein
MRWYAALGSASVMAIAALLVVPTPADAQTASGSTGTSIAVRNAKNGVVVPPALADVEVMCALLTSCGDIAFPIPAQDMPGCVSAAWEALSAPDTVKMSLGIRDCALRANSCREIRECALSGADPNVCNGRGMKSEKPIGFCDLDGRAVSCWRGKPRFVRDCPRAGEQCSVAAGKPICSLGPCPANLSEGSSQCSGNGQRLLQCMDGRLQSRDCSVLGLKCEVGSEGKPICVPPTKSCSVKTHRCDGKAAVGCVDGHEVKVLCDAAKMSCALPNDADKVGVCSVEDGDGPKCDPKAAARCVGNKIEYCIRGQQRAFLCKTFGFNRCVAGPSGPKCGN